MRASRRRPFSSGSRSSAPSDRRRSSPFASASRRGLQASGGRSALARPGSHASSSRSSRRVLPRSHPLPEREIRGTCAWRGGFLVVSLTARFQDRRKVSTASTRRDSFPVDGRPSLPKMLETYFSTARRVITSRSAIPWFELPDAISSSTSRSRGVKRASGSSGRWRELHVLGEDEHADARMLLANLERGTEPLVVVRRWQADVDDHDVGPEAVHLE